MHTKVLIIGSGPAGYSAAIYVARSSLDPILISGSQPGGQLTITTDVENYPGFADVIQGPFLMEQMRLQALHVGAKLIDDHVVKVDLSSKPYRAWVQDGSEFTADSVIICTGAQAKWLGLPSESKYQGYGVSGCATCDGFFYRGKDVAVIGGGNSAVEEALYLTNHAAKVTLVHRRDSLRAEMVTQKRLFEHPKINVIWDSTVDEILGTEDPLGVTGIRLRNVHNNQLQTIPLHGVFVAIGHTPNSGLFKDYLKIDHEGYIITEADSTKTTKPGIFAAGDVQDKIYRQAVTAAGTGCMAALEVTKYLQSL
jgi:thioredoxin reductase (NADPH)